MDNIGKYKLSIIGDSGVGKSSILHALKTKSFNECTDSTIGCEFFCKQIILNKNKMIKLLIWDTAGQEVFRSFTTNFLRGSKVVIIVYDVTNYQTFDNINLWVDEILKMTTPSPYIILIGNKSDLNNLINIKDINDKINNIKKCKLDYYGNITAKNYNSINTFFNYVGEKIIENNILTTNKPGIILDKESNEKNRSCC